MIGREVSDLPSTIWSSRTHLDDLPDGVTDALSLLARGELERIEFEQRYLHSDGHKIAALATAASFTDESARLVAIIQVLDTPSASSRRERSPTSRITTRCRGC